MDKMCVFVCVLFTLFGPSLRQRVLSVAFTVARVASPSSWYQNTPVNLKQHHHHHQHHSHCHHYRHWLYSMWYVLQWCCAYTAAGLRLRSVTPHDILEGFVLFRHLLNTQVTDRVRKRICTILFDSSLFSLSHLSHDIDGTHEQLVKVVIHHELGAVHQWVLKAGPDLPAQICADVQLHTQVPETYAGQVIHLIHRTGGRGDYILQCIMYVIGTVKQYLSKTSWTNLT